MAVPVTIWSARRWIANTACTSATTAPATMATTQADHPRAAPDRAPDPEERADQHHALEADVHDPGALAEDAAEGGVGERRRVDAASRRRGRSSRPARSTRRSSPCTQIANAVATTATKSVHRPSLRSSRVSAQIAHASRAEARARPAPRPPAPGAAGSASSRPTRPTTIPRIATPRAPRGMRSSAVTPMSAPRSCRRRLARCRRRARPPCVHQQELGADEEDDQALDDDREVAGELGREHARVERARRRADLEPAEEQRRERDADRGVPAEQRDGDADEADLAHGDVVRDDVELPPEHVASRRRGPRTRRRSRASPCSCARRGCRRSGRRRRCGPTARTS